MVYRQSGDEDQQTLPNARPPRANAAVCSAESPVPASGSDVCLSSYHEPESKRGTVLYLAYGSNLCDETFKGKRGIRPLSSINVQVPSLRLTFDLPGLPYTEPCFANSGLRETADHPSDSTSNAARADEKTHLLQKAPHKEPYRKDRWHKGLIGVVYECTPEDYAHIIATEGGGASYHDILVDCHPFASSDPSDPVPQTPVTPAFKASAKQ